MTPSVLFVCVHNAGRSQMAAGWLRHLAGDRIEVRSAGSAPADGINPAAVAAMAGAVGGALQGTAAFPAEAVRLVTAGNDLDLPPLVAGLLALWRLHGLDDALREAWQAGVVLTGVSAGSICWHVGGTTDSYGPPLRPVTGGLALLPYSNGVHHDSEPGRRPLFHRLVADGTLPTGHATDDGAGLLYRGTTLVEALAERPRAGAYRVEQYGSGGAVETALDVRRLV